MKCIFMHHENRIFASMGQVACNYSILSVKIQLIALIYCTIQKTRASKTSDFRESKWEENGILRYVLQALLSGREESY